MGDETDPRSFSAEVPKARWGDTRTWTKALIITIIVVVSVGVLIIVLPTIMFILICTAFAG